MLEGINLNNLSVDESGRVSFSGLSSGIDLQGTVDAIIAARRIPVDRLEATVETNDEQIASLKDLRTILESMRTSLSKLYGQVSFGNNSDIFAGKQAFASSSRIDGTVASPAGNLLGVTVANAAAASNHTIEVLQTAKAQKVSSDQITNVSTALGFSGIDQFTIASDQTHTSFQSGVTPASTDPLGSAGTIQFTDDNGIVTGTVAYLATDTISDLATAISTAVTGVTATVENVANGVRLSLVGTEAFRMTETSTGTVLTDFELGVTKINVTSSTSLLDLRDLINQANTGTNATGVNAGVVTVSPSESYLVLTAAETGVTMTLSDTVGAPLDTIGLLQGANVAGNLFQASDQFDNTYWASERTTVSADTILAPDGTLTGDGLIGDTSTNSHYVHTTAPEPLTAGQNYMYSAYAKAGDLQFVRLQINGAALGGGNESADFDLINGIISPAGPPTAGVLSTSIEDVGNGWYRVSMKVQATATGTANFDIQPVEISNNFTGDGTTVNTYLWGAQLEPVTTEVVPDPYVSTTIKIKNELQASQNAQLYADGVLDQSNLSYESDFQTSATVAVGSDGTLSFNGGALGTVPYTSATTLTQLAADITANVIGVTATVVTEGNGVRLEISGTPAFTISETAGGTAIADLGIDNKRKVIERQSNTIDDLFAGVTLSLFAAEKGTTIYLDIEQDLSQVKTEIVSFVESYNLMRQFVNSNKLVNSATGELADDAGVLSKSLALTEVARSLSQIIGSGVAGVDPKFTVLSQVGIDFVDITQEDPLLAENLEIDDALLDSVLLSNADDVRKLFNFNLTTSDPRISLLNFTGSTQFNSTGYTLNLQPASGDNQLQYSEQADNAYWTTERTTVAVDTIPAPDGSMTGDGLIGDLTTNSHYLRTTTPEPLTAGQSYIYSAYAKAGDLQYVRLQLNGAALGGGNESADFDLINGVVSAAGPPTAGVESTSIEDAGDGWYRVSMKITATATGTANFDLQPVDISNNFTGDGATVNTYLWGMQLEPVTTETEPGSYIETTNAAVSGHLATANIGGAADGSDDGSATVANNVITVNSGTAAGLQLFFSGLDFTTSNQLDLTVGVGAQMYFEIGDLLDVTTGIIDGEIDELTDQNRLNNERITEMLDRLEIQRQNLLERYISMETAIASANRIMDSLRQTTDQLANSNN